MCITFYHEMEMDDAKLPRITRYLYFFYHLFLLLVPLSCICAVGIWVALGILDSQMISIGLNSVHLVQ